MREWYDNQKKPTSDWRKKLAERMAARKRRNLTKKEKKRLEKLEGMCHQLKREENVQNCQLKKWLTENEYKELVKKSQDLETLSGVLKRPSLLESSPISFNNFFVNSFIFLLIVITFSWTKIFRKYRRCFL